VKRRTFLAATAGLAAPAIVRAASETPFRIGALLSQSGVFAVLGNNIQRGLELGFEQQNWQAGGRQIEIIREDDEVNPQFGLQKVRKLVGSDHVDVVTGPVGSNVALAIAGFLKTAPTIFICSGAGVNAVTRERRAPNIFRTSTSSWQSNAPTGAWMAKNGATEVAVIASDYSGGHEAVEAFKSAYLPQLRATGAPATYAYMTGTDAVRFVQQYDQFGLKTSMKLYGTGFMVEQDALPAEQDAALGVISGLHYSTALETPENRAFVAAYRAKYGEFPSCYSEYGYVTALVIANALAASAGGHDRDSLLTAIGAVNFTAPRGPFRFDPATRNVVQNIYIREVAAIDGRLDNKVLATIQNVADPG
jgi:branched-chain amino acid transport system substrate-binding protein